MSGSKFCVNCRHCDKTEVKAYTKPEYQYQEWICLKVGVINPCTGAPFKTTANAARITGACSKGEFWEAMEEPINEQS
jgi:hypothetical protein